MEENIKNNRRCSQNVFSSEILNKNLQQWVEKIRFENYEQYKKFSK